jgi:hypothetical protein
VTLENHYRQENVTIVTNFVDGINATQGGPMINFFPTVQTFYNYSAVSNATI